MKKLHTQFATSLLILFIIVSMGNAQDPGELLWDVMYTDVGSLGSLEDAGDGRFVHIAESGSDVLMRWVNSNGIEISSATVNGTGAVEVERIVSYPDGGYLICGETGETVPGTGAAWIVRTGVEGDVIWQHEWDYGGDDNAPGVMVDSNEDILVTGYVSEPDLTTQAFLWKLAPDGTTIFQNLYGGAVTDLGRDVIQTDDGGYLIVGRTSSQGMGDFDGWIFKTDVNGVMLWEHTYGTVAFDMLTGAVELEDGFMLGGRVGGYGDADGWLVRTDLFGDLIWENLYGEPNDGWDVFNRITLAADGNIGFCGFYEGTSAIYDVWIGEISIDGTMMWDDTHGFTQGFSPTSTALDFREIPEGGYMVCGQGRGSGWLLRIYDDPNQTGVDYSDLVSPTEFRLASVYPNPFNAQATVTVQLLQSADLTVSLYNIAGQQVCEMVSGVQSAGTHQFTLDAANLSSGLYFVHATVPGKMSDVQRVMLVR